MSTVSRVAVPTARASELWDLRQRTRAGGVSGWVGPVDRVGLTDPRRIATGAADLCRSRLPLSRRRIRQGISPGAARRVVSTTRAGLSRSQAVRVTTLVAGCELQHLRLGQRRVRLQNPCTQRKRERERKCELRVGMRGGCCERQRGTVMYWSEEGGKPMCRVKSAKESPESRRYGQ